MAENKHMTTVSLTDHGIAIMTASIIGLLIGAKYNDVLGGCIMTGIAYLSYIVPNYLGTIIQNQLIIQNQNSKTEHLILSLKKEGDLPKE